MVPTGGLDNVSLCIIALQVMIMFSTQPSAVSQLLHPAGVRGRSFTPARKCFTVSGLEAEDWIACSFFSHRTHLSSTQQGWLFCFGKRNLGMRSFFDVASCFSKSHVKQAL